MRLHGYTGAYITRLKSFPEISQTHFHRRCLRTFCFSGVEFSRRLVAADSLVRSAPFNPGVLRWCTLRAINSKLGEEHSLCRAESSDMARSVCKHTRHILCLSAPLSCGACRLGDTCAGISWAPLYPDMRPFVLLCWAENLIRNPHSLQ